MSRDALRTVLLDLKSQMRGARASAYVKKGDSEATKKPKRVEPEESGDHADSELEASEARMGKSEPKAEEKAEGPVDFADEMKKFMKKRNNGKGTGPSRLMTMATESAKPSAAKKKGK